MSRTFAAWLPLLCFLAGTCAAQTEVNALACGSLDNHYGPFDYSDPVQRAEKLPIVDRNHFNSDVENLIRGQSGTIMGDLDYTLRTFPNHHRALNAVARYDLRGGKPEQFLTAECYFERAMRFQPRDGMVYLINGVYLHSKGELETAEERYLQALQLLPDNAEAHYNLGLLYVDMKRYDDANAQAVEAYRLGHPLQGLKRKLIRLGAWQGDVKPATAH